MMLKSSKSENLKKKGSQMMAAHGGWCGCAERWTVDGIKGRFQSARERAFEGENKLNRERDPKVKETITYILIKDFFLFLLCFVLGYVTAVSLFCS